MSQLQIKTAIQINRQRKDVFEAIVDPQKMSNYFIAEGSGRMEEGKALEWRFSEFEETVPITVMKIKPGEYVSFEWEGAKGKKLLVEMNLLEVQDRQTVVKVIEGEMEQDEAGITWYGGNTEGWANFLASLKAYMEHGINLRKGAFDYMKK